MASCGRLNPGARVDNIFAVGKKSCLGAVRHSRMEATGGSTTPFLRQIGCRERERNGSERLRHSQTPRDVCPSQLRVFTHGSRATSVGYRQEKLGTSIHPGRESPAGLLTDAHSRWDLVCPPPLLPTQPPSVSRTYDARPRPPPYFSLVPLATIRAAPRVASGQGRPAKRPLLAPPFCLI